MCMNVYLEVMFTFNEVSNASIALYKYTDQVHRILVRAYSALLSSIPKVYNNTTYTTCSKLE